MSVKAKKHPFRTYNNSPLKDKNINYSSFDDYDRKIIISMASGRPTEPYIKL